MNKTTAAACRSPAMTAKAELVGRLRDYLQRQLNLHLEFADYKEAERAQSCLDALAALTEAGAREAANLRQQIDDLANFIIAEVPGEPSQNEGAVECAIRWMRERLASPPPVQPVVKALRGYLFRLRYGPDNWSRQLMFSEVLPDNPDDVKEVEALYALAAPPSSAPGKPMVMARPIQLWPFEERPGPFADRLHKALRDLPSTLAAIRNVLIEEPPTLSDEYLAALTAPPTAEEAQAKRIEK